ncbi:hypothetical protein P691DRAFT_758738 [Macrolepiota fuliginosa MF-IS2]|uniref:Uncharacterized protein n=1 Tax=Macrolepiota fuliginosa MF-IS2 TaxID=1400762 RepID=A0A9P5XIE0_9AGAR|nr:hypothetical protein P691DRAFT_758738 [Macrolepiota fuliginosa MF-IS2]
MAIPLGLCQITWGPNGANVGRVAADEPDNMDPKPIMVRPGAAPLWMAAGMPNIDGVQPGTIRALINGNTLVDNIGGFLFGRLQGPPNAPVWEIVPIGNFNNLFQIRVPGANLVWTVLAGAPPGQIALRNNIVEAGQAFMIV